VPLLAQNPGDATAQEQQRQLSQAAEGNTAQLRDAQRGDDIAAQSRSSDDDW